MQRLLSSDLATNTLLYLEAVEFCPKVEKGESECLQTSKTSEASSGVCGSWASERRSYETPHSGAQTDTRYKTLSISLSISLTRTYVQ